MFDTVMLCSITATVLQRPKISNCSLASLRHQKVLAAPLAIHAIAMDFVLLVLHTSVLLQHLSSQTDAPMPHSLLLSVFQTVLQVSLSVNEVRKTKLRRNLVGYE